MSNLLETASAYAADAIGRKRPPKVTELAIMNLIDWFAVAFGARDAEAAQKVARVVGRWGMRGPAAVLTGGTSAPVGAALINGTLAHCLDYDDLHFPSLAHLSAPTWAAVLAVGADTDADESAMLDAFLAGFEISARLGSNGVGKAITDRGWHSTGVHGRISAAIASGVLRGLDAPGMAHAIAIAATQTSGLTTSFGTMAKPFHAGKAAADGVLAADLALEGFEGAAGILDDERNLVSALVQDDTARMRLDGLGEHWEIERNALKPYACCGLTHAPVDCARELHTRIAGRAVEQIHVTTHELASKVANHRVPKTPLAGKFSLSYCVALGLAGHRASETDFTSERLDDLQIQDLERRVSLRADNQLEPSAARMEIALTNGETLESAVQVSLGNPENPMTWADLEQKFNPLIENQIGAHKTRTLFETLRHFEQPGAARQALEHVR